MAKSKKDKKEMEKIVKHNTLATPDDWSWVWLIVLLAFWQPQSNNNENKE